MTEWGMEIELDLVLAALSYALWLAVLILTAPSAIRTLTGRYFLLALFCLPLYVQLEPIFHAEELLTSYGMFDMWFRHAVFYLGQVFFFLFVFRLLSKDGIPTARRAKKIGKAVVAAYALFLLLPTAARAAHEIDLFTLDPTPYNILLFLTDQGLQHVLAVLFFFFTIAIIRTQGLYRGYEAVKSVVYAFFVANCFFILLHIWEYAVETQHLLPWLDDEAGEGVEFGIQYVGLILFYLAFRKWRRLA